MGLISTAASSRYCASIRATSSKSSACVITPATPSITSWMMSSGRFTKKVPEETRAPGVHILTGPIYIEGAEPGDTLECRVLHMAPGSNTA